MGGRLMIMMLFYLFVLVCSCACAGVFLGDLFANSFSVAVVLLLFLRGVGRSVGAISSSRPIAGWGHVSWMRFGWLAVRVAD